MSFIYFRYIAVNNTNEEWYSIKLHQMKSSFSVGVNENQEMCPIWYTQRQFSITYKWSNKIKVVKIQQTELTIWYRLHLDDSFSRWLAFIFLRSYHVHVWFAGPKLYRPISIRITNNRSQNSLRESSWLCQTERK